MKKLLIVALFIGASLSIVAPKASGEQLLKSTVAFINTSTATFHQGDMLIEQIYLSINTGTTGQFSISYATAPSDITGGGGEDINPMFNITVSSKNPQAPLDFSGLGGFPMYGVLTASASAQGNSMTVIYRDLLR